MEDNGHLPVADKAVDGVSFLRETRVIPTYPSLSERYYKHKLFRNEFHENQSSNQDFLILAHSNKICLVTLAPTHEILALKKNPIKVDFGGEKTNRLENKVTGKWKKGAQKVRSQSILCTIECDDGSIYKIRACINGKIVEINHRLVEEPSLLTRQPWSDGFVAIILPPFQSNEVSNLPVYNQ